MDTQNLRLHELVRSLGLSRSYAGYKYLVCALELLREEPERLELVTKGVYPEVARRFGVTFGGVDKGLRTAAEVCREGLGEILPVREFLAAVHRMDCERQGQNPCPTVRAVGEDAPKAPLGKGPGPHSKGSLVQRELSRREP